MLDSTYGITKKLHGVGHADAVGRVVAALAAEGFGVLTEIDVKATMKTKLDADFRDYTILGACNPPLALRALNGELAMGLLLPCNVVVTQDDEGSALVAAIDPEVVFGVVGRDDIGDVARAVKEKLHRVMAAL